METKQKVAIGIGLTVILLAGIATAQYLNDRGMGIKVVKGNNYLGASTTTPNLTTTTVTWDQNTQYLGKCAVVTPPTSDPCDAAQGELQYSFWQGIVNATIFNTWKSQNPGEWTRLQAHMANPQCSTGAQGQPQDMLTPLGVALYAETRAYNCALGTQPITMPAPNPPRVAGATDKKPPSAPGPLNAQLQPLTITTVP